MCTSRSICRQALSLPALAGLLWLVPALGLAQVLGEASVVVGRVSLVKPDGQREAVVARQMLPDAITLETGSDGYLYINTVDRGVISLRPNASLTVERYRYDPAQPQATEIRLTLNRGVVRTVSGQGAQAARQNFRMNTPMAAIGIRGTDFSVYTSEQVSRATVRSGGIVMAPFGAACLPQGVGPCDGETALALFAAESPSAMLQLSRGESRPVLVAPEAAQPLRPDVIAPPLRHESALPGSQGGLASVPDNPVVGRARAEAPLPAEEPLIHWGRWRALASETAAPASLSGLLALMGSDPSAALFVSPHYGMVRQSGPIDMPRTGEASFVLMGGEARIAGALSNDDTAAQILNPRLTVNFGTARYSTSLEVQGRGLRHTVLNQGQIDASGLFRSDRGIANPAVNSHLQGGLAGPVAQQAGYVFESGIPGTALRAVGATFWQRPVAADPAAGGAARIEPFSLR
jgi:hypothetical protein